MLLFIILQTMGLTDQQVATVVALAFGINPILDMFETMNNVTGDLVCTYTVAHNENLIGPTDSAEIRRGGAGARPKRPENAFPQGQKHCTPRAVCV
jgi:Na+/H+-dicarboxylate symporter